MNLSRRCLNICLSLLVTLPLFISSSANATSLYDNLYQTTNTLSVCSNYSDINEDLTFDYQAIINGTYDNHSVLYYAQAVSYSSQPAGSGVQQFIADQWNNQKVRWSISESRTSDGDCSIMLYYTTDDSLALRWEPDGIFFENESSVRQIKISWNESINGIYVDHKFATNGTESGWPYFGGVMSGTHPASNTTLRNYTSHTNHPNYPEDYEGDLIEDGSTIYNDDDELSLLQELQQGTSDNNIDSDGDGISDYKESIWFEDRDEVFCDTSATPYVCAYPNPTVKDIYIEIDWMENSSRSFQPNSTQISGVMAGLGDYGYNVHVDAGEYGGGNALPYITNLPFMPDGVEIDYFDLKDGDVSTSTLVNFNPKRKAIWRYLISGYNYSENSTSSGAAFIGGGDIFVSYGYIQDNQPLFGYTAIDTAIAGTVVHETGHSLCLSQTQQYSYQSMECRFSGIDTQSLFYDGVMNYNLQMLITYL